MAPAFGLFAVAASGGEFIELPLVEEEDPTASVQILHNCADPAAASVDVWVNGERAPRQLCIPQRYAVHSAAGWCRPDGCHHWARMQTMPTDPVFSTTLNLMADGRYVVVASGVLNPDNFAPNSDPNAAALDFTLIPVTPIRAEATDMNSVDFYAFHGATDAPAVDVRAGETNLFENLSYGAASDYASVPGLPSTRSTSHQPAAIRSLHSQQTCRAWAVTP